MDFSLKRSVASTLPKLFRGGSGSADRRAATVAPPDRPETPSDTIRQQVIEAYDIVLRRWPDRNGLEQYSAILAAGRMTLLDVIRDLYQSDEARDRPGDPQQAVDPHDEVVVLAPIFEAARDGRLADAFLGEDGRLRCGHRLRSLLTGDLGQAIVAYHTQAQSRETVDE